MEKDIFLSIIIPAYNEGSNISDTLSEIREYVSARDFNCEVIVADDGSVDDTVAKARRFGNGPFHLNIIESRPNRGKGYILKKAMLASKGRYAMCMDGDSATSIYELDKFFPCLDQGCEIVIGSRRLRDSDVTVSEPPLRIFLGRIYLLLSKTILGLKVSDVNCGFKMFTGKAAKKLFSLQRMNDWSLDAELLFLARRSGMKLKEVPVRWAHNQGTSKVRPLKAGIESFLSLLKIRMNGFRGLYGAR